jgi:molecular chaperone GrpE
MSETSESKKPDAEEPSAEAAAESGLKSVDAAAAKAPDESAPAADPPAAGDPSSKGDPLPAQADPPATAEAAAAPEPDPLEKAQAEAKRMKEAWMRAAADLDNFRKRSRREIDDARKAGGEGFLRELLPVFDNLERGVQSAQRAQDVRAVAEGLLMILKQFEGTLARAGISKVPSIGNQFDPTVHEAIQQVETDEHPPGTVVSEVQAGYMNGDRLVRAALVVVAKSRAEGAPEAKPDEAAKAEEPN